MEGNMHKHVVVLREYERGWGQKDFIATEFPTKEAAMEKVRENERERNLPQVPDYYIVARYVEEMTPETFKWINR